MGFVKFIQKLIKKDQRDRSESVEHLRVLFKARYQSFKQLLAANNRALEIMADIERALSGNHAFGMPFVRSSCTAISVNVFRMIKNLDELAPEKFNGLYGKFSEIQKTIDGLLKIQTRPKDDRWVLLLEEVQADMADTVGIKMGNLAEMKNRIQLPVPEGFVITAQAYHHFMLANDLQAEIDTMLQSVETQEFEDIYTLSAQIQQMIIRADVPEDLMQAVSLALDSIRKKNNHKPVRLAVRSSALGEDMAGSSFAGQYRSELNISCENVFEAYKEVVASKYSLQAMTYRLNRGFKDEDIAMSVGCLVMVDARCGGVMYTRNPVDASDDAVFINAVWGLPKSVVDGVGACDIYKVAKQPSLHLVHQDIKKKTIKFTCDENEGVCRESQMDEALISAPTLSQEQALSLAQMAIRLEAFYTVPQDIEWVMTDSGEMMFLQCRPLSRSQATLPDKAVLSRIGSSDILLADGVTASPGVACGPVYHVERGSDVIQFPKGGVLVTQQALPRWASLLSRASAVVTEQGGFAGHLANVAREFGIPALFGAADAMTMLHNGDEITVDADRQMVFRGKIDLSPFQNQQKNIMAGSPVYETLRHVSRFIVPLNLLDPDAKEFTPDACQSFHDITRFIHEKSVQEMFSFGKAHNFSERSSKQLHYNVPMQWWILNLDDGFKEEVSGKYVKLENIVSVPMLAFWDGFAAIPWEGPPAVDGKGLASVMFQATTNPALTTGLRSKYAEKNYFMISKHYLSLNSRLGFHFSILEAVVGDRKMENYINFQFKGGAANLDRRLKRVVFIGEILEKNGFRVTQKEDTLLSRIENQEEDYMIRRLKVLGYLTLHTRQLDMIMTNPDKVSYYMAKMQKDIQTLA